MSDLVIGDLRKSTSFFKSGSPSKIPRFYQQAVDNVIIKNGLYLEFGTGIGDTAIHIANKIGNNVLYTFDWFKGLPEDWIVSEDEIYEAGHFAAEGAYNPKTLATAILAVDQRLARRCPNVRLIVGQFEHTLPSFVKNRKSDVALMHVDCDLYSSTKTIFEHLRDRIVSGTVIIFDEFWNYSNYEEHEYRAFMEFIQESGLGYKFLGHVVDKRQASLIIQ